MTRTKLDVTNIKTGKGGMGVMLYTRRDGVEMVEVIASATGKRHWRADHCIIKPWGR